jgi:hypothetical protein
MQMKTSKVSESGGGTLQGRNSTLLRDLPLAWSWPRPRIDSRGAVTSVYEEITDDMLHEFVKYIQRTIECEGRVGEKWAVRLLRELVDLVQYARHE